MCQHLKELPYTVTWYFSNDQCITLQNHVLVKDPFKVQDISIDFSINEYKTFINIVFYFTTKFYKTAIFQTLV